MSTDHLPDNVIVIRGAAGGFGALLCRDALARGAKVAALDIDIDALDTLATDLGAGSSLLTISTDVTDLHAVSAAVVETRPPSAASMSWSTTPARCRWPSWPTARGVARWPPGPLHHGRQ